MTRGPLHREDAKGAKGREGLLLRRNDVAAPVNQLSQRVIGAALEVHRNLGAGFLEAVYEEALCIELELRGIRFQRQVPVRVAYKGRPVGEARLDLLVDGQVVVELKAVEALLPVHQAQVISYLRATKLPLGLLLNFNAPALRLGIKRIVLT